MLIGFYKSARHMTLAASLLGCGCQNTGADPADNHMSPDNTALAEWVTADFENIIPQNELNAVEADARNGNDSAVDRLAEHYRSLGKPREQVQWLLMAASRGDCSAMAHLREIAQDRHDAISASRWNDRLRSNRCTWAKAYGALQGESARLNDRPLWTQ